jgi:hypothetical protein
MLPPPPLRCSHLHPTPAADLTTASSPRAPLPSMAPWAARPFSGSRSCCARPLCPSACPWWPLCSSKGCRAWWRTPAPSCATPATCVTACGSTVCASMVAPTASGVTAPWTVRCIRLGGAGRGGAGWGGVVTRATPPSPPLSPVVATRVTTGHHWSPPFASFFASFRWCMCTHTSPRVTSSP